MLKRTSLFEEHQRLGGRMVDFGGWELPVQYSGVMDEHLACRSAAGLFDVSHMGEVHVTGIDAEKFLNWLVTNNVSKLAVNQAQYTAMCNETGGIIDDLVIYKRGAANFLVVVNASNTDKDFAHISRSAEEFVKKGGKVVVSNESAKYAQIAIQGPRAEEILQKITPAALKSVKTYWFVEAPVLESIQAILARTGYTGEDGFEVYVPWSEGPAVWKALYESGKPLGLKPCGLGARDTLRLEMKYALYGHELTDETNALEAGLGWVTKFDKEDFIGRPALARAKEQGLKRKLVGIKLTGRGIPRQGYSVYTPDGKEQIGVLTSGTQSPSTKEAIGIAYVANAHTAVGSKLSVEIRGAFVPAEVVETPFLKRSKK